MPLTGRPGARDAHRTRWLSLLAAVALSGCAAPQPTLEALPSRNLDECRIGGLERARALDVVFVIDTSGSTSNPSGFDIDGDGIIGERRSDVSDRRDSLLSAQVVAVKSLISEFIRQGLRISIVSYAGKERFKDPTSPERQPDAILRGELTSEAPDVDDALGSVLANGSRGTSNFAAAMSRSLDALQLRSDPEDSRRGLVLLMSDSPTPVMPGPTVVLFRSWSGDPNGPFVRADPKMAAAAKRAIRSGVVINTFGLGEAAAAPPPHALSRVAGATGGKYRAVQNPARLHCELMAALVQ